MIENKIKNSCFSRKKILIFAEQKIVKPMCNKFNHIDSGAMLPGLDKKL